MPVTIPGADAGKNSDFYFGKDVEASGEYHCVTNVAGDAFMRGVQYEVARVHCEHRNDYLDHIKR